MTAKTPRGRNCLSERMVRNDDIFCSLLFDHASGAMRIVDFRGGNFQTKHAFLERTLLAEGMRKIFTLIERDDMNGWQRVGYIREGTIPGYYKRSDAYIMSRIYDADWNAAESAEESPWRKAFLADVKNLSKDFVAAKGAGLKIDQVDEVEAVQLVNEEIARQVVIEKKTARETKKGTAAAPVRKLPAPLERRAGEPIFPQFSREIESYFVVAQNRRTRQLNLFGAEYQDCFGNAKVDVFFTPASKPERSLALTGLNAFVAWLAEVGAVALFALVPSSNLELNALFTSAGFRNSGWLSRQLVTEDGITDLVLWTRKLAG
jgi:hypothetical protein